jgi:transposase
MSKRERRSFTKEYKAEVVDLIRTGDKSVGAVCRDLGLTETAVRRWLKQAETDSGQDPSGALTTVEREELTALRKKVRTLERMQCTRPTFITIGSPLLDSARGHDALFLSPSFRGRQLAHRDPSARGRCSRAWIHDSLRAKAWLGPTRQWTEPTNLPATPRKHRGDAAGGRDAIAGVLLHLLASRSV